MEENKENQNLPEEVKGVGKLKVKIKNKLKQREEDRIVNDVVFYEKLTPEKEDLTVPLQKGNVDMWFLIFSLLLICFGTVMSYSASSFHGFDFYDNSAYFFERNLIFVSVAIVISSIFIIFARPWFWKIFGAALYPVSAFLLLLVLIMGVSGGGAERWIQMGPVNIQPSEIAKLALVMMLALYLSKFEKQVNSSHKFGGSFKHGFFMPMLMTGSLCALIIFQPHLSGTIIVGLIGLAMMFMGGTRMKWLGIFLGIIGVGAVIFLLLFGYTMDRVTLWLDILFRVEEVDPHGSAWQTLQGLYAIGSGGFFGLGLGSSRQKYGYVSQPQNDFVFTIVCEELGFIGAFALILLFILLIWRGIKIGQNAPDKFCSLVVWGLTFKIAVQTLMNIAVVTNSMPNTGISLPFFSSGGTANMLQIFEVGIILSISRFSKIKKQT